MSLCSQWEVSGKYYEKHDHRLLPLHGGGVRMGGGEGRGEGREENAETFTHTQTHTHIIREVRKEGRLMLHTLNVLLDM